MLEGGGEVVFGRVTIEVATECSVAKVKCKGLEWVFAIRKVGGDDAGGNVAVECE